MLVRSRKGQARVATVTVDPAVLQLWLGLGVGLALFATFDALALAAMSASDSVWAAVLLMPLLLTSGLFLLVRAGSGAGISASVRALARRLARIGHHRSGKCGKKAGKEGATSKP